MGLHICIADERHAWRVPAVFRTLQEMGGIDEEEMFRVFNMGIGFVVIVRPDDADRAATILAREKARPVLVGYVREGSGGVRLS